MGHPHDHDQDDVHADCKTEYDLDEAREEGFEDGKAALAARIDEIWPQYDLDIKVMHGPNCGQPIREYKTEVCDYDFRAIQKHEMSIQEVEDLLKKIRALIDEVI